MSSNTDVVDIIISSKDRILDPIAARHRTLGGVGLAEFQVNNNGVTATYIATLDDDEAYSIVMAYDTRGMLTDDWHDVKIRIYQENDAAGPPFENDEDDEAEPGNNPLKLSGYGAYGALVPPTPPPLQSGGGLRKKAPSPSAKKWTSTGRKTKCSDGSKRTLWRCSATGELRVRRVSTRNGKQTTRYVKP